MDHYRFVVVSPEPFPDHDGVWMANIADVASEARRLSQALVRDYPDAFETERPWTMHVLNGSGELVATYDMRTALDGAARLARL